MKLERTEDLGVETIAADVSAEVAMMMPIDRRTPPPRRRRNPDNRPKFPRDQQRDRKDGGERDQDRSDNGYENPVDESGYDEVY